MWERKRKETVQQKKKRRLISRLRLAGSLRNWGNFLLLLLILRVRAYYVGAFLAWDSSKASTRV